MICCPTLKGLFQHLNHLGGEPAPAARGLHKDCSADQAFDLSRGVVENHLLILALGAFYADEF